MASDVNSVNARVLELIEDARRLAYAQGYQDAIQNIVNAAGAVHSAPFSGPETSRHQSLDSEPRHKVGTKRAPWGLVPKAIERALNSSGDHGIDLSMVSESAMELGHPVAESSVRTFLITMTKSGAIERRDDGRWYRVKRNDGATLQERPAVSYPFDQGGTDEAAALV